ncbi:MAG: hypothetical protein QF719_03185 [Chloroflexota bacterium]|nr:hypothetical protein [Chloroflexota bacterium]
MSRATKEIPYLPSMQWVEEFAEMVWRRPPRSAVIDSEFLVDRSGFPNSKYGGQLLGFLEVMGLVEDGKLTEAGKQLRHRPGTDGYQKAWAGVAESVYVPILGDLDLASNMSRNELELAFIDNSTVGESSTRKAIAAFNWVKKQIE